MFRCLCVGVYAHVKQLMLLLRLERALVSPGKQSESGFLPLQTRCVLSPLQERSKRRFCTLSMLWQVGSICRSAAHIASVQQQPLLVT